MSDLSSRKFLVPGLVPVILAVLVALSTGLALSGGIMPGSGLWPLAALGDLLFRSFHVAGFYLPVYLAVIGILIMTSQARIMRVILLSLGIVPAMLAGLSLRLMLTVDFNSSPVPAWMVANLTHQGAVIVSAASTLIALVVLLQLPSYLRESSTRRPGGKTLNRPVPVAEPPVAEDKIAVEEDGFVPAPVPPVQATPKTILPNTDAINEFRSAMSGKLESHLKTAAKPVDLDAPLESGEIKTIWSDEEELARRQAALEAGRYEPRRPMFYQPGQAGSPVTPSSAPDPTLAVYFSKAGEISDYPPRGKRSWTTLAEDESLDEPQAPAGGLNGDASAYGQPAAKKRPIGAPAAPAAAVPLAGEIAEEDIDDYLEDEGIIMTELPGEPEIAVAVPPALLHDDESSLVQIPVADQNAPVADWRTMEVEAVDPADAPESIDTSILPPMETMSSRFELAKGPGGYRVPIKGLLEEPKNHQYWVIDDATTRAASILKQTLEEFGIAADVTGIRKGPVITMFEILPAPGVKLAKIVNLADNIALRLAAQTVRIVAPIPGKHAVGIEIPNRERAIVSFSELLMADGFSSPKIELPVALGIDISGEAQIVDLTKTPHLLIAGSTGSGKSVCVNALICSLLYRCSPAEVNMILIDPKIVELKFYNDIPHLLTPVITDAKKAFQALQWCLFEMERRYSLLDAMQVRDIKSYNKKIKARHIATPHLPYLVVVIDEFADLMATSGKELEGTLARLAAMSRAVGIHLVLATQRPSADVITGLIKANIPSRIAFMVASKIDSRIIIDGMGAEKLLGKGDMLFTSAWDPFPFRMQGAFLSEEEVERIVTHVKTLGKPDYIDDEIFFDAEEETNSDSDEIIEGADDPLLKEAIDIVVAAKKASASYIQRRLKIGYNRAARMVEQMEDMGIVGPAQGSKPREILRMFQ